MNEVADILDKNIAREAWLITDRHGVYKTLSWNFSTHSVVDHSKEECVSKEDRRIHMNTIEGYFSIFKRGMRGVYQHCAKKHLHRYAAGI